MISYWRLLKHRKAEDLSVEDLMFWVFTTIIIIVIASLIYFAAKSVYEKKLDTNNIEHFIWSERIIASLSYKNYGRTFNSIIDFEKFSDETLANALILPSQKRRDSRVFKVILKDIELGSSNTIYSDKELYDDAVPLMRLKYLQNQETKYVLIRKNNQLRKGILEIVELYPK